MYARCYSITTLVSVILYFVSGCAAPLVSDWGDQKSVPPVISNKPASKIYDYSHKEAALGTDKKWTVAILRFGDSREINEVPFGPDLKNKQSADGGTNVNVEITGIKTELSSTQVSPQISKRSREMLKSTLIESNAFIVVERERIEEILREINFSKTQYTDSMMKTDQKLLPAYYLLEGSLGINEDQTLGSNYEIACYLSAYDVRTGIVAATAVGLGSDRPEAIRNAVADLIRLMQHISKDDSQKSLEE